MLKTLIEYSVPDGEDQNIQHAGMQWLEDTFWDEEDSRVWFNGDGMDPQSSILDLLNYQMAP